MKSYNLGGHSGCKIFLMENEEGPIFVRKISKDKEYNERLKVQCEKQAFFDGGKIKAPKVYNTGTTEEGLFFFDMEYVQGITLAERIKTMEIGKVRGVVESLVQNLVPKESIKITPEEKERIVEIFQNKVVNLKKELKPHNNDIINKAICLLESHDWTKCIPSQCHGDMTLENIIVKNENLYFIDFLDSFYDSWILDIGTLLQDVQAMWSYRYDKEVNMNTVLRLMVFKDLLLDAIGEIDSQYVIETYYALLQKLIRIFPYTKDDFTYKFLNEKVSVVLKKIGELERRKVI